MNWSWEKELEFTLVAVPVMYCMVLLAMSCVLFNDKARAVQKRTEFRQVERDIYRNTWAARRPELVSRVQRYMHSHRG